MKNFKLLSLLLSVVLCFSFVLTACDGSSEDTDAQGSADSSANTDSSADSETENVTDADDGKVTYTVKVTDADGNPVSGAAVQLCRDTCLPGSTDENGTVTFTVVEDDYKVSFLVVPAGYALSGDETEFYFEDGSYEMTLVLTAAE